MARNNHNGATHAIAELLKTAGPMTREEIVGRLGLSINTVKSALSSMVGLVGGAVHVGKRGRAMVYGVPGRDDVPVSERPRVNVAGPRYMPPQGGVLQRNPFEHMQLCQRAR